jgi:hypothetical protein
MAIGAFLHRCGSMEIPLRQNAFSAVLKWRRTTSGIAYCPHSAGIAFDTYET